MSSVEERKPRFFYGYVMVAIVFCIMLLSWGIFLTFGVFFEPVLAEFGWTRATTSAAFSLSILVMGLLGFVVGRLTDRLGPRLVMTGCGFFVGLGFLLMSQIGALWQLYLFYGVITGIGMSATFVPANSIIARWFVRRRATMTGVVLCGSPVGTMIMPPVARWLISIYGWREAYIIAGIAALVLIVVAAQFLKSAPEQFGKLPLNEDEVRAEGKVSKSREFSIQEAFHTRQFWLLSGISACTWFCVGVIMVHIVIHATGLGIPAASAASIMALMGGVSIAGRLITGTAADRIGNRSALIVSFAIMSASLFWLVAAQELWALYLFGALFGFAWGGLGPLVSPVVAELFGLSSHGAILGVSFTLAMIGEAFGPVLAGRIFDVTYSYQWAFLLCAAVGAIGIVLSCLLTPINGKAPSRV